MSDEIIRLRAEVERLRIENIQMQAALGYAIMAEDERHILPTNPYKCGTCDASSYLRAENERLLTENAALAAWQCEFVDGETGLVAHEHGGTYCAMATKVEQLLSVLADTRTDNMRLREWNAEIALNGRELVAENERLRAALGNLLAIIHRDGGHHTDAVGEKQSVEDAHKVWAELMSENERLRAALKPILNYPNIREKIGNQLYDLGWAALGQPAPGKEEV